MLPWNIHIHFLVFKEGERFALKTQNFTGMACSKVESLSLVSTTRCPGICSGIDIACAKTTHYVLFYNLCEIFSIKNTAMLLKKSNQSTFHGIQLRIEQVNLLLTVKCSFEK